VSIPIALVSAIFMPTTVVMSDACVAAKDLPIRMTSGLGLAANFTKACWTGADLYSTVSGNDFKFDLINSTSFISSQSLYPCYALVTDGTYSVNYNGQTYNPSISSLQSQVNSLAANQAFNQANPTDNYNTTAAAQAAIDSWMSQTKTDLTNALTEINTRTLELQTTFESQTNILNNSLAIITPLFDFVDDLRRSSNCTFVKVTWDAAYNTVCGDAKGSLQWIGLTSLLVSAFSWMIAITLLFVNMRLGGHGVVIGVDLDTGNKPPKQSPNEGNYELSNTGTSYV